MSRMTAVMRQFGTLPPPPPKPEPPAVNLEKLMSELSTSSVEDRAAMDQAIRRLTSYNRFKYPETANEINRNLSDIWGQHRFASTQQKEKIIRGFTDAVLKAEERFDQSFGGWVPRSNQFGYTPLRATERLNRSLDTDEEVYLVGWVAGQAPSLELDVGSHRIWADVPAGYGPIPMLYFPEPMIIEPRAYIGKADPTATLVGYYFAPCARLMQRGRER